MVAEAITAPLTPEKNFNNDGTVGTAASSNSPSIQNSSLHSVDDFYEECEEIDDFDENDSAFDVHQQLNEEEEEESDSEDSDSDYSGSSSDDDDQSHSEMSSSGTSTGTSTISDEWSSGDEEEYADLMAEMPIALGRSGPAKAPARRPAPTPAPPQEPQDAPLPIPANVEMTPAEGLAMFQNIRKELEQVGRMIVEQKSGEKFLQRAHILASINWLSANVPSCVLDHLGKEIRSMQENEDDGLRDSFRSTSSGSGASTLRSSIRTFEGGMEKFHVRNVTKTPKRSRSNHSLSSSGDDMVTSIHVPSDDDTSYENMEFDSSSDNSDDDSVDCMSVSRSQRTPTSRRDRSSSDTDMDQRPPRRSTSMESLDSLTLGSVLSLNTNNTNINALPAVSRFSCALLFVDISGFTRLSTLMDAESLSKVINSYFQMIVDKITEYGGDIKKFVGDALFADWEITDETPLEQCVGAAAACAVRIVEDCADFPVTTFGGLRSGSLISKLNVHCGLGVGEMSGLHVGDSVNRREYLNVGETIEQATTACDKAMLGEVVVSPQFYDILKTRCPRKPEVPMDISDSFVKIANRSVTALDLSKLFENKQARNAKSRGVTEYVDGLEIDALKEYRRLVSLYCHAVVAANDIAANGDFKSSGNNATGRERLSEEAELRSVYTMFIRPTIELKITGDDKEDAEAIDLLNKMMNLVTRELLHYCGHLRQYVMDDKGIVLIATFGLRGSTVPNMVCERALPATLALHHALLMELGVQNTIGATFGDVYCGAVGAELRHEYAVMGPSVNLAARLMCSKDNPGVLVDNTVRNLASRAYSFKALNPIKAKGYKEPVPIFEPLTPLTRSWGRLEPNFVGRTEEITTIASMAMDMLRMEHSSPRMVMITSPTGMGKTTLLVHAIENVRQMLKPVPKGLIIAKHAGRESDALLPFSTIRPLIRAVLTRQAAGLDSLVPGSQHSGQTTAENTGEGGLSNSQVIRFLKSIASELNVSQQVFQHAKHHLFNTEIGAQPKTHSGRKAPSQRSVVVFLTRAFLRCIRNTRLVIFALDDVHQADEMSWKVLRGIFEAADNVLIVATSCMPARLRIEDDFWDALTRNHAQTGRFINMALEELHEEQIVEMTMKSLSLQRKDVSPELLKEVMVQSGGMPQFAIKILDGIKSRGRIQDTTPDGEADDSVAEIILHRVDGFDVEIRMTLNVGAVLGPSFTLREMTAVLEKSSDKQEGDIMQQTLSALRVAVKSGILLETRDCTDEPSLTDGETTRFTFHRAIWRSTLLGLMLGSRKRDLHRKIASSMEEALKKEDTSIEYQIKLVEHWKSSGDTTKTTKAALRTGQGLLNQPSRLSECCTLYEEILSMWGWNKQERHRSGFDEQVLQLLTAADLENILSLMVALGKARDLCGRQNESIVAYENALRTLQGAKSSNDLKDRSVVFPAFIGLSKAIANGNIKQDVYCRYEQAMLRRFLQETHKHGRLIHHIQALYMQTELYSRLGALDKAVAVQSIIKELYKPDRHSRSLKKVYGSDAGALSFSMASFWQMVQGEHRKALRTTRRVLKEFVQTVESDMQQSFAMMYPVVLVLKESGYPAEAKGFFEKIFVDPYRNYFGKGKLSYLSRVCEPLFMLLELSDKKPLSDERHQEILSWACDGEKILMDPVLNLHLARLGRCGHSISAEICFLVASNLPKGAQRNYVIAQGNLAASQAVAFNRRKGLKLALNQAHAIHRKLKTLGGGATRRHTSSM